MLRRVGDVALVLVVGWLAALATVAELSAAQRDRPGSLPPTGAAYALALGAAAVLVGRVRFPVGSAAAAIGLTYAYRAAGYPGEAPGMALFVACYSAAAHARGRRGTAWATAVTAVAVTVPVLPPASAPMHGLDAWSVVGPGLGMVTAGFLGASMRYRRAETEQRVQRIGDRTEAEIARRLAAERLGIARELHDVLAHTISVITVQSGLALDVLADDPQRARPALEIVRASSREAVGQVRAAVRALRGEDTGVLAAPLTLASLDRLADGARAAGLEVTVTGAADGDRVPPLLQAAAYRIVQEALTNCLRHSRGHRVAVRVTRSERDLTVEVVDDGPPAAVAGSHGPGLGLVGIRERADAVGGHAETGWTPAGYRVFARLPMPSPAAG